MSDLKSSLQILLQEAGYDTWLASADGLEVVGFEDDVVMGFGCVFEDVVSLLNRWRTIETVLLTRHASSLQRAGEKTWNVYSVFLCPTVANEEQSREVSWIEEDLERTRKIAACGVLGQSELTTALLPLLPIQYQPSLDSENFDLTQRLRKRIGSIAPQVVDTALDDAIPATEVVRLLGSEP